MDTFDRLVAGIMAGLVVAIGVVIILGDRVGVTVTARMPDDGRGPSSTAPISLVFSQPMDVASVEERLSIEPAVEGELRWDGGRLIFRPSRALVPEQKYTVTLEAGAESLLGRQVIRSLTWSFTPRLTGVVYLAPASAEVRSLWLAALDDSRPREIYVPEYGIFSFATSLDGEQIALTILDEDGSADIWLVDASGGNPHRITDCQTSFCSGPSWSPDGNRIAYERQEPSMTGGSGTSRIWLVDLATGQSAPVFEDNQVLGFSPTWSPDGQRLAFFDGNSQAIRVLDLDSGDTFRFPSLMGEVGSFSPDGTRMAYTDMRQVGRQFFTDIILANLGTDGGIEPLIEPAEEDQSPVWSPDGKWIAFGRRLLSREEGFGIQLMIVDPATGELRQLTDDPGFNNSQFAWSPSGDRLLLHRFDLKAGSPSLDLWVYNLSDGSLKELAKDVFGARWLP